MGHNHIPKTHVDESPAISSSRRSYARGIIDEAAQYATFPTSLDFPMLIPATRARWGRGSTLDAQTPSDTSDEFLGTFRSSEVVFFKKDDVVLIGK